MERERLKPKLEQLIKDGFEHDQEYLGTLEVLKRQKERVLYDHKYDHVIAKYEVGK